MNIYRKIDREKVQFDFLVNKKGFFDEEIRLLGGIIHQIPYISEVNPIKYERLLRRFFMHNSYVIVHSHINRMSGVILKFAKKR